MRNFWWSYELPLLDYEKELDLRWEKNFLISETSRTASVAVDIPIEATKTSAMFRINNAKLYVPVFTLSINDNIKFLKRSKQWFKRKISWKK